MGLQLNARKCKSIHMVRKQPRGSRNTQFHIEAQDIEHLSEYDSTKLLGRPVGFHILQDRERIEKVTEMGLKILNIKLAPWQRLDALGSFVLPVITFAMRTWQYRKQDNETIDKTFRSLIKATLSFPTNATNEYNYGSTAIARFDRAPDYALTAFFNEPQLPRRQSFFRTVWSKAKATSQRLGIKWGKEADSMFLQMGDTEPLSSERRKVASVIRTVLCLKRDESVSSKPDQGKRWN